MMKRGMVALTGALAFAIVLASCAGTSTSGPQGRLSGVITDAAGKEIKVQVIEGTKLVTLASDTVGDDGTFEIIPSEPLPQLDYYYLALEKGNQVSFIADSTQSITFKLDGASLQNSPQATGSPQTTELYVLLNEMGPLVKTMNESSANTRDPKLSTEERSSAVEAYQKASTELRKVCGKFVRNNPNSPVALEALAGLNINTSMESYKTVLASLKPTFANSTRYQYVLTQVNKANIKQAQQAQQDANSKAPQIGQVAPDIEMTSIDGGTYKLSDLRGKVVLLDFWASWCGPCRRENPNVVRAYAEYKDKGFEVFSVSLDSKQDRWEKAIAQDGLTWPYHVSDLKGWKNAAAALYDVHSIPATFLLDKEGKVVGTKLRGPALDRKLEELLNS